VDCFQGGGNGTRSFCESRGCCWDDETAREQPAGVPACYYPLPANAYNLTSWTPYSRGAKATLTCSGNNRYGDGTGGNGRPPYHIGPYGSEICPLELEVFYETDSRLRVRIRDPSDDMRWEVPTHLFPHVPNQHHSPAARKYSVSYTSYPFGLAVTRQGLGGGEVVFNSTPVTGRMNGLSFEDQFISFSTRLSTGHTAQDTTDESASQDGHSVQDEPFLFGLAEHNSPFRLPVGSRAKAKVDKGKGAESLQTYTLYARDRGGTPRHKAGGADGLYGSHPFLMQVSPISGLASGMLLLNSNAMDVVLATDSATFRTVGGVIDLYIFLGHSPADVVQQLTSVVGKPVLPPYWALGFHLCRWGYGSAAATRKVVENMRAAAIPHDVQWNDIDHMDAHKDFTLDPANFAPDEMRALLDDLHLHGQRYVMIVDPGIASGGKEAYPALASGLEHQVFIRDKSGLVPAQGSVWPGDVFFPDFLHPNASAYWQAQLSAFHDVLPFDGVWLDMNEPSNFCDGDCSRCGSQHSRRQLRDKSKTGDAERKQKGSAGHVGGGQARADACVVDWKTEEEERRETVYAPWKLRRKGGKRRDVRHPPYLPGGESLESRSLRMDTRHCVDNLLMSRGTSRAHTSAGGSMSSRLSSSAMEGCTQTTHYDAHNIYGLAEARVTAQALEHMMGTRPFVISRSTFPGSGVWGGHWLGDNEARWMDLQASIPAMLTMGISGVSLVGADICGFAGEATRELCIRWTELGALYPFSRNHNTLDTRAQEPSSWDAQAQTMMKRALDRRYRLLPYFYTLFYSASLSGAPVARSLLMEFASQLLGFDTSLQYAPGRQGLKERQRVLEELSTHSQFMLGPALMVTPVMMEGWNNVSGVFFGKWYDFDTGAALHPLLPPEPLFPSLATAEGAVPPFTRSIVAAPLGSCPLHIRGGHAVPLQRPALTSRAGRVTPFTYYFASDHAGASDGQVFLDDGEALHSVELGSYTLLQLSSALVDGGLSGNVSSLVLKGGYDPQVDPLISHPLGLEEVVIMGLDAHALQGRSISAICNGQPFPSFSIYFDPFTSTMRFLFGAKAYQKHDKSFAAAEPLPLPSVMSDLMISWTSAPA